MDASLVYITSNVIEILTRWF